MLQQNYQIRGMIFVIAISYLVAQQAAGSCFGTALAERGHQFYASESKEVVSKSDWRVARNACPKVPKENSKVAVLADLLHA